MTNHINGPNCFRQKLSSPPSHTLTMGVGEGLATLPHTELHNPSPACSRHPSHPSYSLRNTRGSSTSGRMPRPGHSPWKFPGLVSSHLPYFCCVCFPTGLPDTTLLKLLCARFPISLFLFTFHVLLSSTSPTVRHALSPPSAGVSMARVWTLVLSPQGGSHKEGVNKSK